MRIAITGASGLIGSSLASSLAGDRHEVIRVPRGTRWDPEAGVLEPAMIAGAEAIVHLAGESIAVRWTKHSMARILGSRVNGTQALVRAVAALDYGPRVLVSASAIGYYGNRGDEPLDEASTPGSGFLADLCREWEAAAEGAAASRVRVVRTRLGVVLSHKGGALARMLPPFRMGLGGPIGRGTHYMSWITLDDAVAAIRRAIDDERLAGPVNVVGPNPVRNVDFAHALGRAMGRPAVAPAPAFALRLAFGQMADEVLLASQRVLPRKLAAAGFEFRHSDLDAALRAVL